MKRHVTATIKYLDSLDMLPIGSKIKKLDKIINFMDNGFSKGKLPAIPRELGDPNFLHYIKQEPEAQKRKEMLKETIGLIKGRLAVETEKFADIKETFKRWNANIDDKKLLSVSIPDNCEVLETKLRGEHLLIFTFKSMNDWILENTNGKLSCKKGDTHKRLCYVVKMKGFAHMFLSDNKEQKDVRRAINIQLTYMRNHIGKDALKPPLSHPELLILYLSFKHLEANNYDTLVFCIRYEVQLKAKGLVADLYNEIVNLTPGLRKAEGDPLMENLNMLVKSFVVFSRE